VSTSHDGMSMRSRFNVTATSGGSASIRRLHAAASPAAHKLAERV